MSNNVCQYCNGYETTAGFMHEARCSLNKSTTTYYNVPLADEQSEISRLHAELEKAESVLAGMETNRNYWVRKCDEAIIERDEARKWARKLYRMGIKYQKISRGLNVLAIKCSAGILNEPNLLADEKENG